MKSRKIILLLTVIVSVVLFAACSASADAPDTPAPSGEIEKKAYKFKISKLPYDSEGLEVIVRAEVNGISYKTDLGTVESCAADAYIEKTVQAAKEWDKMWIVFLDSYGFDKYSCRVTENCFNQTTETYEIDGYYLYHYRYTDTDPTKPYAACSEAHLQTLELNREYSFNSSKDPFLVFELSGARDKKLKISQMDSDNIDIYVSTDKSKLLKYNNSITKITDNKSYDCGNNNVLYFMIRATSYNKDGTARFTFIDVTSNIEKCLNIDKAIIASDGNIYASGTSSSEHSKTFLWKINPVTGEKTKVKNYYEDISYICELDPGTLYVAYKCGIGTIDLATGICSDLVTNLPNIPSAISKYKDNKLVITGRRYGSSAGNLIIFDEENKTFAAADYADFQLNRGNPDCAKELFYISSADLFVHSSSDFSPKDISYLKFTDDGLTAPKYYSIDSQYHDDYGMKSPLKVISQSASEIKIISADGNLFIINPSVITDYDKTTYPDSMGYYRTVVDAWCVYDGNTYKAYDDCYFNDTNIYYMITDKTEDVCIIFKCALSDPKTVIDECSFPGERGIQFFYNNNQLFVLANGTEEIYKVDSYGDYEVYLHEIDF